MACHLRSRATKQSSFRCHCSTALTAVCAKRGVNGLMTCSVACSVLLLERMVKFCARSAANCDSFHHSQRYSTQSCLHTNENGDDLLNGDNVFVLGWYAVAWGLSEESGVACHIGSVPVERLVVLSLREFQPAMVTVESSCALHSPLLHSMPMQVKALIRSLDVSLSLFCLLFPPIERCRAARCNCEHFEQCRHAGCVRRLDACQLRANCRALCLSAVLVEAGLKRHNCCWHRDSCSPSYIVYDSVLVNAELHPCAAALFGACCKECSSRLGLS